MYIGPWQEYKLAAALRKRRQAEEAQQSLRRLYMQWNEQVGRIGEKKATKELIWGPLFSALTAEVGGLQKAPPSARSTLSAPLSSRGSISSVASIRSDCTVQVRHRY